VDGDAGAYGVAIADGASELESQDVAVFTVLSDAITEDAEAAGIGTGEVDVEPAVLIEVKGGEGVPRSVVWSLRRTTRLRDFSAVEIPRPSWILLKYDRDRPAF
jgi:hypothetical protein